MSARNEQPQNWFRMPVQFDLDEEFLRLSPQGQLLFLRIVAMCSGMRNGGKITSRQLQAMCAGQPRGREIVRGLVTAGVLTACSPTAKTGVENAVEQQSDYSRTTVGQQSDNSGTTARLQSNNSRTTVEQQSDNSRTAGAEQVFRISNARKWLFLDDRERSVPAGQATSSIEKTVKDQPRAHTRAPAPLPARGEKERKTDRTESSPASPDGLDSVARAAPRLGGAESRPAPETKDQMPDQRQKPGPGVFLGDVADRQGDGDSLDGLEHLTGPALAKAALSKAIANGSRPIRLPVRMSKYPRELYPTLETEKAGDDE